MVPDIFGAAVVSSIEKLPHLLVALALWGAAMALVCVATTAQPPEAILHPMTELLWPAFKDGDLSLNHQSFLEGGAELAKLRGGALPHDAWNLGELMGLRGKASLLPLVAMWGALAALYARARRRA